MSRRLRLIILTLLLALAATAGGATAAKPAKKSRAPSASTFEVCRHDCRYRTIQQGADAAGTYAKRHRGTRVKVAVQPGRYVEGVVLDGTAPGKDFDRMTIEGTGSVPSRTVLDGRGSGALDGIEAIGVDGLVLENIQARNFESSGFLVRAGAGADGDCDGYTMSDLLATGNRVDGLAARGCLGGRMIDSVASGQGDAGFSVGGTPCDSPGWSVYDASPCQATPRYALLRDDESHENSVGYAGPDAKYVLVTESAFYDDGVGILAASLGSAGPAPGGWSYFERNDVFWNNYDPYLAGSGLAPPASGLGVLEGRALNYPTGVGILLYGADHDVIRGNHVFGNYKWGIATLSRPAEAPFADEFDEARSLNSEIVENQLGRGGADPNGAYDIFGDATGGGSCWGANSANSTFAPGSGKVSPGQIYPVCPQAPIGYAAARTVNAPAGLQANPKDAEDPSTSLGYLGTDPPQDQQCSWKREAFPHLPFQRFKPVEVTPGPNELGC